MRVLISSLPVRPDCRRLSVFRQATLSWTLRCHGTAEELLMSETMFRADRLKTMRMRLSAAYKGVNALLMKEGAQDFRSGQKFDHTVFLARTSTSITSFLKIGARSTRSSPLFLIRLSIKHLFPTVRTGL
jgi:hypothetical protein